MRNHAGFPPAEESKISDINFYGTRRKRGIASLANSKRARIRQRSSPYDGVEVERPALLSIAFEEVRIALCRHQPRRSFTSMTINDSGLFYWLT